MSDTTNRDEQIDNFLAHAVLNRDEESYTRQIMRMAEEMRAVGHHGGATIMESILREMAGWEIDNA